MAARNPFGFPVSGDVEGQLAAVLGPHTERVLAELDDRLLGGFDDVPWDELSEGYRTVKPFVRMPRSETRYTGLMGREHTQSLQKGYLDLGLVNPQFAKMLKADKLGDWLLMAMKQEGVAYIRDPEGVLKKSGVSVNDIADGIKQDLESYYAERSEVADTPEERDALERIFKAIKGARITFSSVKGRQGDPGYKVVMKPSPGQIQAMGLQREDLDELAMTKEITVKLADKKVTVRIPKGLRAGTREFMKGIRFAERIEVPIDKNAQNNEKKLENFTPKTPPHIIQYTVGQAIPKPPALRLAEKLTSMAMTKAGIKKQAFQTQGAEDLYMAAAKSNAPFWAGVMAAGRALFQVADTFDKEYHEQEWKRLSEKALETIGYPGQNEKSAFKKKLAIRKARARIFGEQSVERVQGSGTPLEEAKVRRRRKVTAKKARRRQRAVAAGVKPDKPDKVYKSSVSMSTPEGFFDRMVTYKLPMADSKAPPGAERALLILDDSEVPDGAYNEIVGYLGRPDSERQRSGGFEAGFANAPEWTAYDTDGRVVASKMMFADAVSDLLLFYNDEIEAAALDYLKAPSRGKFASAFSR